MARAQERHLLLLAVLIAATGLTLVHLARGTEHPWTPVGIGTLAVSGFLVPHLVLAVRQGRAPTAPPVRTDDGSERGGGPDPLLLPLAALLVAVGLPAIYRLDPVLLLRQALWVVCGQALMVAVLVAVDVRAVARYRYLVGAAALLLLAAAVLFGVEVAGTRQWIRVGPVTVQPSESVKVLLVLFAAAYLSEKRRLAGGASLPARFAAPLGAVAALALL
ncbi:MAG: FtsW/RodA/SpoVE family cell cycle protein, partial [Armatimonadota bacterium]|nr:FtsW/RodA/SpoVE family cell cycle protein [Armatimonadota bacterium]